MKERIVNEDLHFEDKASYGEKDYAFRYNVRQLQTGFYENISNQVGYDPAH